jgi:hypothetical protein
MFDCSSAIALGMIKGHRLSITEMWQEYECIQNKKKHPFKKIVGFEGPFKGLP